MTMKAMELKGRIDEEGRLQLQPLSALRNRTVKVIILVAEEEDPDDEEWLAALPGNASFDFLQEEEDLYSLTDGIPFVDEV